MQQSFGRDNSHHLSLFISIIYFLLIFGLTPINPHNVAWLLNQNDAMQHLIGWEFYRHEPWHFPLGTIQNYGFPIPTSIVYTDSIPALAIIFKLINHYLPENFQYFGLWMLICFSLQGLFAYKLTQNMHQNLSIRLIITIFFIISPILLNRSIEHHSLMAQWLILAGIWLYKSKFSLQSLYMWLILNLIALMIHAYFAAMLLALECAYFYKNITINKQINLVKLLFFFIIQIVLSLLLGWILGYFVLDNIYAYKLSGYQAESINLISPIMPTQGTSSLPNNWSRILKTVTLPQIEQSDEGFSYMGFGMLFLCSIAITRAPKSNLINYKKQWLPIIIVCSLLTIFALSNRVTFLDKVLFSYNIPTLFIPLTEIFRASGRFFWPMYYLLFIIIFFILSLTLKTKKLLILLIIALTIQIIDLLPKLKEINHYFKNATTVQFILPNSKINNSQLSKLTIKLKKEINEKSHYKHLIFIPYTAHPLISIPNFHSYIYFAAKHNMTTNLGYFARANNYKLRIANQDQIQKLLNGKARNDTIYIITNPFLTKLIIKKTPPTLQKNIIPI